MNNKPLTLVASPNQEAPEPIEVTWASHVLIPLAQNVAGGVAVAGLCLVAVVAANQDIEAFALWAGLAGATVACTATVIRFFADDFGIVWGAYQAGQRSRDSEINALQLELQNVLSTAHLDPTSAQRKLNDQARNARRDVQRVLEVHFGGEATTRAAMQAKGMGQRDWERAMRLLRAAGCIDEQGTMLARSPHQALKAIDSRLNEDGSRGRNYSPAWA
jgi:hypothetical protein